jgi:hypothetical protein
MRRITQTNSTSHPPSSQAQQKHFALVSPYPCPWLDAAQVVRRSAWCTHPHLPWSAAYSGDAPEMCVPDVGCTYYRTTYRTQRIRGWYQLGIRCHQLPVTGRQGRKPYVVSRPGEYGTKKSHETKKSS